MKIDTVEISTAHARIRVHLEGRAHPHDTMCLRIEGREFQTLELPIETAFKLSEVIQLMCRELVKR